MIGAALIAVPVVNAVRVKGFARLSPGDCVTLFEATNVPRGSFMALVDGEMARVPRTALLIDRHTCNVYLHDSVRALLQDTDLLIAICSRDVLPHHLMEMLAAVPGALVASLRKMVSAEVRIMVQLERASEIMRSESPALRLLSTVTSSAPIRDFQHFVTAEVVSAISAELEQSPADAATEAHVLVASLRALESCLRSAHSKSSPLLTTFCAAFEKSSLPLLLAGAQDRPVDLLVTVFFLRIICPAIVQSGSIGGITSELSEPVKKALLRSAKVWQHLANGVEDDVSSDALQLWFAIKLRLHLMSRALVVPERSSMLLEEAVALYALLQSMGVALNLGAAPLESEFVEGRPRAVIDLEKRLAAILCETM